jgi:hypothetical protein
MNNNWGEQIWKAINQVCRGGGSPEEIAYYDVMSRFV